MHLHHNDWYLLARDGKPPPPWEDCLKETFFVYPGERILLAGHFSDHPGKFVDPLPHVRPRGPRPDEPVRGRAVRNPAFSKGSRACCRCIVRIGRHTQKAGGAAAPGRSEARAIGALLLAGAGLVALSLSLPHPSGGNTPALIATRRGDGGRRPALLVPLPAASRSP